MATDFSFETGMVIFTIYGIFCLIFIFALVKFWKGFQNMTKFWVENEIAKSMSFSKFIISYISGNIFNDETELYKKSRNQFSLGFGLLFIDFTFLVFANEYLYEPLEMVFRVIPH